MPDVLMIEQNFINDLIKNQKPAAIFLRNGIKLTGIITGIDDHCLFLKNVSSQMIYKDAISTIQPLVY